MIGELDAGNPHVQFDEGVQETCDSATRLCPTLPQPLVIISRDHAASRDFVLDSSRYNRAAFTGAGKLVRKATGYEQEKLKPRYPTSGSRAARTELIERCRHLSTFFCSLGRLR
jgi:hypothetical protein